MAAATPPSPGGRNLALDGLRGVAIGLVLIQHYYVQVAIISDWHGHTLLKRFLGFTFAGVELFFVLSGYLIGSLLLAHRAADNLVSVFYLRRLSRTLPAYVLLLLAFLVARSFPALNSPATLRQFAGQVPWWSYALMAQNILMTMVRDIGPWWLVVTWSLAVEEQFYFFMPWLLRILRPRALLVLAGLSLAFCPLLRLAYLDYARNPFGAIYLLPARMDSLLLGVALAALCQQREWRERVAAQRRLLGWGAAVFGLAFVIAPLGPAGERPGVLLYTTTLLGLGFALVLLYVLLAPDSALCRVLRHPGLLFLGGISYFVYLFHLPLLYTLHSLVQHGDPLHFQVHSWLTTAASLAAVLLAGAASRRWLELPFLRLGHKLGYRDPA